MASNLIPLLGGDENSMDVDQELTSEDIVEALTQMLHENHPALTVTEYRDSNSPILPSASTDSVIRRRPEATPQATQTVTESSDKEIQTEPIAETCDCSTDPSKKRNRSDDDDEEGKLCSICFDIWSNSGDHRLCALRCGHLFGHSCLMRWLDGQKTCPSCKSLVRRSDIRFIYAKKLITLDTSELNAVKVELDEEKSGKNRLQIELSQCRERENLQRKEIRELKVQIDVLKAYTRSSNSSQPSSASLPKTKVYRERSVEIHKDGGCRVMDYYKYTRVIVVSAPAPNPLFSAFGVRKVFVNDFTCGAFIPLHAKMIRDVSFHPQQDLLLSVSVDKMAKLTETANNKPVCSVQCSGPLWSCCWDNTNPNCFYIGEQMGAVSKYDTRKANQKVCVLPVPGDLSPVVSVASPVWHPDSALRQSSVLVCKLNSCWAFDNTHTADFSRHPLSLEGPFVSMRYDNVSRHLLVSSRPNARHAYSRHTLCSLVKDTNTGDRPRCNLVHVFSGSPMQKLLSRTCQMPLHGDVLVAAHHESKRAVEIWSAATGAQVNTVSTFTPVIDMCPIATHDAVFLCTLNERKLDFFKIEK